MNLGRLKVPDEDVARLAQFASDRHPIRLGRVGFIGDDRFIPGLVEGDPGIVVHTSIDGDVGPHAGDFFHAAHGVKGRPRLGGDRPPRLDQERRQLKAPPPGLPHDDLRQVGDKFGRARGVVDLDVADAESSPKLSSSGAKPVASRARARNSKMISQAAS